MSAIKWAFVGLGGLLLYNLFSKGSALGSLKVFPGSVDNFRFEGATPVVDVSLIVQNTSGERFTFNSATANVYVETASGNVFVGNINSFNAQSVEPNSQTKLTFSVSMAVVGVVQDLIRAIENGNFSQKVFVDGSMNVSNTVIPFQMTYDVP